jgi:hypothetical protein
MSLKSLASVTSSHKNNKNTKALGGASKLTVVVKIEDSDAT